MLDTLRFESRYLDIFLAPLDQDGKELYKDRSPIHHTTFKHQWVSFKELKI
ncbi:hypothetical protein Bpfe_029763, partial [Biomphalaria pfeifferi]